MSKKIFFSILVLVLLILSIYIFVQSWSKNANVISPTPTPALNSVPTIAIPKPNAKISSPLAVSGTVPSGWMFEGVFPVKLLDANRKLITQTQAKESVSGSWTSGSDVVFEAILKFIPPGTSTGLLVIEKDNPSGLTENADSYEIPVSF